MRKAAVKGCSVCDAQQAEAFSAWEHGDESGTSGLRLASGRELCCEMFYDAVKTGWGRGRGCIRVHGRRWGEVREVYDCCGEVWQYGAVVW